MTQLRSSRLSREQLHLTQQWLPDAHLRADMSWNLVDTVVLDVETEAGRYVVKAGGPGNHHIGREITAHETVTSRLAKTGHAARLIASSRSANLLLTEYLPGELVENTPVEYETTTHYRAGAILRRLHDCSEQFDDDWEAAAVAQTTARLNSSHRIADGVVSDLRAVLTAYRPQSAKLVPTHGDWSPRNWLNHDGTVKVIDFGRFDRRPPATDFCRLASKQWQTNSDLETAFFDGYGDDLRDPEQWRMSMLHEAIGTAVWAYQVGDEPFERHGHRMIADALNM